MNTMKMPGFTAEVSIYQSTATYFASPFGSSTEGVAVVQPQFRAQVRRGCGPCVNGTRSCFLYGYECTVEEGVPGNEELGIPPARGFVNCNLESFQEWEQPC